MVSFWGWFFFCMGMIYLILRRLDCCSYFYIVLIFYRKRFMYKDIRKCLNVKDNIYMCMEFFFKSLNLRVKRYGIFFYKNDS